MTRCDKCHGCLVWEPSEWRERPERRCLNCGARPDNVPLPEPSDSRRRPTAFLPVIVEVRKV